jgi:FtsZ-binding cell division protein ZapB/DNA-directed RNA polymerase subunit RPC12/RpoP
MSRSRKRNLDTLEHLQSENRELKSINKSLQREIKSLKKDYKTEFSPDELIKEEVKSKQPQPSKCSECNKTNVTSTNLGTRTLIVCNDCGRRKTTKNG